MRGELRTDLVALVCRLSSQFAGMPVEKDEIQALADKLRSKLLKHLKQHEMTLQAEFAKMDHAGKGLIAAKDFQKV